MQASLPTVGSKYNLIWPSIPSRVQSFSEAYSHCRPSLPAVDWFAQHWKNFTPTKIFTLVWRLLWDRLPIDDQLQKRGILLASFYSLCQKPCHVEALNLITRRTSLMDWTVQSYT